MHRKGGFHGVFYLLVSGLLLTYWWSLILGPLVVGFNLILCFGVDWVVGIFLVSLLLRRI